MPKSETLLRSLEELQIRPWVYLLLTVVIGTMLNATYNVISASFGAVWPKTYFLFDAQDRLADFFKVTFSFPGVLNEQGFSTQLFVDYLNKNPYGGYQSLGTGELTHFHHPPMYEFLFVGCRILFDYVNPWLVYLLIITSLMACFTIAINYFFDDIKFLGLFLTAFVFSYPFLMMLTRGNVGSLVVALSLIIFMLLIQRGKLLFLSCAMLAIAVNFKPNSLIFGFLYLFIYQSRQGVIYFLTSAFFSGVMAIFFLILVNWIYPAYTHESFFAGLDTYNELYVIKNWGLDYGSSLYGALVYLAHGIDKIFSYFIIMSILTASIFYMMVLLKLYRRDRIDRLGLVFAISSIYILSTPVFADYHLLVLMFFVLEISFLAKQQGALILQNLIILVTSIILCIPKNYIFLNGHSLQLVLNPAILLFSLYKLTMISTRSTNLVGRDE